MSIDILSISTCIGGKEIPLEEIAKRFGKPGNSKSAERCGTTKLHKFYEGESLELRASDVALAAMIQSKVLDWQKDGKGIDGIYACVATSSTYQQIPGLAREVGRSLNMDRIPMITLSMGCAGGLHALQAAYNQMSIDAQRGKKTNYLVISGDHTDKVLDNESWDTAGIFSDGVAAIVLSNHIKGKLTVDRVESTNLIGDVQSMAVRNEDRIFRMNGVAVYEFATRKVFPAVLELLGVQNLPNDSYLIPHQASGAVLSGMQRRYKIPDNQFYSDGIKNIGNVPGASVFFGLMDVEDRGLAGDKDIILAGFGAELAVGAAYLKRNRDFVEDGK